MKKCKRLNDFEVGALNNRSVLIHLQQPKNVFKKWLIVCFLENIHV